MKIIILSLIFSTFLFSKDNYSIIINPSVNYNLHSPNFTNYDGVTNYTNSKYGNTSSITPNFSILLNYKYSKKLFNIISDYSIGLNYSNISVDLNRKENLGNFIKENEFYPIFSEVPLNNSISYISLQNIFWFDFNLPINIGANLNLGYGVNSNFSQQENALGKNEFTFENGLRTREEHSGHIPNFNAFNILIGATINYNYKINKYYSILPNISYNFALFDLIQDKEWGYSNINFGVALQYNFIKKATPPPSPPKNPPLPNMLNPEEPKEMELIFVLKAKLNGNKINENNVIDIEYNKTTTVEKYSILPILYFEQNSNNLLKSSGNELFELAHNSLIDNISEVMKNDSGSDITIKTGKFEEKDKKLFENRVNKILSLLKNNGVNTENIKIVYNQVEKLEYRYEELKAEEDKLVFEFNESDKNLVEFTYFENFEYKLNKSYLFEFELDYSLKDRTISSINYNGKNNLYEERQFQFELEKDELININSKNLDVYSAPVSLRTNTLADSLNFEFNYVLINEKKNINKIKDEDKSRYILGYFNFDEDVFNEYDEKVLRLIKNEIKNGKKVKLIPMTDNIGDKDYNEKLAIKRGISAKKLIGLDVEIDNAHQAFFDNNHPYGRTLNRSVIVEVYD